MDPNQEIDNIGEIADESTQNDSSLSVDDFIKQLEAKEKDLHITADTTIIEMSDGFEDGELQDFLKPVPQAVAQPADVAVPPAKPKPVKLETATLRNEIAGLKQKVSKLEGDRIEIVVSAQRRAKDFENFKARTERERKETFQNQIRNLATQMLPALDNLNRAVDFALAMSDEKRAEIQQFFDGIVLVTQQVNDVLGEMGIQPIATVGEIFDPHFHEAVATEESDDFEPNTISAELLRGYRIGNSVLRHSMVKVARTPTSNTNEESVDLDDSSPSEDPDAVDSEQ